MNSWLEHVKQFRQQHPSLSYKECLQEAKITYKKVVRKVLGLLRQCLETN